MEKIKEETLGEGLRLRKPLPPLSGEGEHCECENELLELRQKKVPDDNAQKEETTEAKSSPTDLVSRLWESSKELTECVPTDLPSAKRMLEEGIHAAAVALHAEEIEKFVGELSSDVAAQAGAVAAQAGAIAVQAAEQAEEILRIVIEASWKVCHFQSLPHWLQDNDYLHWGHRPPLPSFSACFQSIFRIHTETGNIWTHLIGCLLFVLLAVYTLFCCELQTEERWVFAAFFTGAILCLGFSCTFHTVHCHSEFVGKLFSKLDYVGIAMLIMGSFVPWLYYSFYCQYQPKLIYLIVMGVLGSACIIVSLWDRFAEPQYRALRAGLFIAFGLSGAIPAIHYLIAEGWLNAVSHASLGWLILMGALYILGALLYAGRIPERYFPGKCDIWFQSHQIFHVLVIAAAFVHYQGISEMALYRLTHNQCPTENLTH